MTDEPYWIDVGDVATFRDQDDGTIMLNMYENDLFSLTTDEVMKLIKDLHEWYGKTTGNLMMNCPMCAGKLKMEKPVTFHYWYCESCKTHLTIYPWGYEK